MKKQLLSAFWFVVVEISTVRMSLVGLSDHAQAIIKQCKDQLLDLTFNCKLRINGLTQLAEENLDLAPHIVACIERRLLTAPPEHVLPSLYVYFKSFFLFLFEIFIFFKLSFGFNFEKCWRSISHSFRRESLQNFLDRLSTRYAQNTQTLVSSSFFQSHPLSLFLSLFCSLKLIYRFEVHSANFWRHGQECSLLTRWQTSAPRSTP